MLKHARQDPQSRQANDSHARGNEGVEGTATLHAALYAWPGSLCAGIRLSSVESGRMEVLPIHRPLIE
jgi:hypothetical protein